MTTRTQTEGSIQRGIVDFLQLVLPPEYLVYANPNASRRTAGGHASNGVAGLTPGIPDLSVSCPDSRIVYFEVKTPRGRLSDVQQEIIRRFLKSGTRVAVVTSINEVEEKLALWGIPTRIAKAA